MSIYKDRDLLNEDGSIPDKLLSKCIEQHQAMLERYHLLQDYYDGKHKILNRTLSSDSLPNNKIVCNHAQYITDMAVGYVFGSPITYSGDGTDKINDVFTDIDEDSHNNELAQDLSIFGVGFELLYMSDDEVPYPKLAVISPFNGFLVCDTTADHKPMFAATYYPKYDIDNNLKGYDVNVYTEDKLLHAFTTSIPAATFEWKDDKQEEYYFRGIPVIEYKNNKQCKGDFEGVLTLIDAYNLLQSDRVNDKEQLVDAFLAIVGQCLGDSKEEKIETAKLLKEMKIIELDEGGDAKWLVKNLNETEIEVLKKSLKQDIHEFSKVPDLTDENFVGNSSGIAMKYKLIGFEQLGKTKERYFKQGLRKRLKLMSNIENIRANIIDTSKIDITMKRSLPVDDELMAKIAQETDGFISWETRLQRFDGNLDPKEERKRLDAENQKKLEQQQQAFGSYDFKNTGQNYSDNPPQQEDKPKDKKVNEQGK